MSPETYRFALSIAGVIISGLIIFSFYVLQIYISDNKRFKEEQSKQNEKFYDLINATKEALVKLSTNMENDRERCNERHSIKK